MTTKRLFSTALSIVLLIILAPTPTTTLAAEGAISAIYTLPDTPVAPLQNNLIKDSIADDHDLFLGGIGSDLWRSPNDPPNEFWMVTDRGPNGQLKVGNDERRTFPIPAFTPLILRVKVDGTAIQILDTVAVVGQSGKPVTGLPNFDKYDDTAYDFSGKTKLDFNQSGIDTEGLARTSQGEFWLCEEYSPSIPRVDKTGKVLKRYVPQGLKFTSADYPVMEALPAIYTKRDGNRGFEGLTLSADEKTLYVVLQSPLANPNKKTGEASRQTRILAFDIASEKVVAEYVYHFDRAIEYGSKATPGDMKISGIQFVNSNTLLVLERTDSLAKLYLADMTGATNILGTQWDDAKTKPSLEALTDPAEGKVVPLAKTQVIDLSQLQRVPDKIEGVAIVDKSTLAIANDNDFDIGDFDTNGNNRGKGIKSQLLIVKLNKPLP